MMQVPGPLGSIFIILFLVAAQQSASSNAATMTMDDESSSLMETDPWQKCQIFMAPSNQGLGWGVFAGRPFQEGEIVEMAPGMIPMEQDAPSIVTSALDDYVYGYYRLKYSKPPQGHNNEHPSIHPMYAVMLGMGMIYNHHPVSPNLEYTTFGREPHSPDVPHAANSIGFKALRDIAIGEELFSTYGKEDGGKEWFFRRNMTRQSPTFDQRRISLEDRTATMDQYCSKIVAGIGRPTWRRQILPILPPPQYLPFWMDDDQWLAPWDAEIGNAFAKVPVADNGRIEIGTAIVLSQRRHLQGTPLAAISMTWKDLQPEHQAALKILRKHGQLKLQYNEFYSASLWNRTDGFAFWADVALLPIGGNMGLVARQDVEDSECNCRLEILTDETLYELDSVVVVLELIATREIAAGEHLRLDLPWSGAANEESLLREELRLMGRIPHEKSHFHWQQKVTKDEL